MIEKLVKEMMPSRTPLDTILRSIGFIKVNSEIIDFNDGVEMQYCQNYTAQIEEATFNFVKNKKENWCFSNFEAVNILSMKMEMELTYFFGAQNMYVQGSNRTYFSRGIMKDMPTERFSTKEDLLSLFEGYTCTEMTVVFCGTQFLSQMKAISVDMEEATLFGIKCFKVDNTYLIHAPLFKEAGLSHKAILVDICDIQKYVYKAINIQSLDNQKVIQENSCVVLGNKSRHCIIEPMHSPLSN